MTETYKNNDVAAASPVGRSTDESVLREKARDAIMAGRLPMRSPTGVWGGPGTGESCAVCTQVIGGDGIGFELEFGGDGIAGLRLYHVHLWCFAAWEFECRSLLPEADTEVRISGRERDETHQREPR
jgi:hypothetical protein